MEVSGLRVIKDRNINIRIAVGKTSFFIIYSLYINTLIIYTAEVFICQISFVVTGC